MKPGDIFRVRHELLGVRYFQYLYKDIEQLNGAVIAIFNYNSDITDGNLEKIKQSGVYLFLHTTISAGKKFFNWERIGNLAPVSTDNIVFFTYRFMDISIEKGMEELRWRVWGPKYPEEYRKYLEDVPAQLYYGSLFSPISVMLYMLSRETYVNSVLGVFPIYKCNPFKLSRIEDELPNKSKIPYDEGDVFKIENERIGTRYVQFIGRERMNDLICVFKANSSQKEFGLGEIEKLEVDFMIHTHTGSGKFYYKWEKIGNAPTINIDDVYFWKKSIAPKVFPELKDHQYQIWKHNQTVEFIDDLKKVSGKLVKGDVVDASWLMMFLQDHTVYERYEKDETIMGIENPYIYATGLYKRES